MNGSASSSGRGVAARWFGARSRWCGALLAASLLAGVTLSASPAYADQATAQALFEAGSTARDAGDLATACEKFEASNRLDEAGGTILNIADCREQLGQLAQAWQRYMEAAEKLPSSDPRAGYARDKAEELRPQVPKVTLVLTSSAELDSDAPVRVLADGKELPNSVLGVALPVDPGQHEYVVELEGHETARFSLTIAAGQSEQLELTPGAALDGQTAAAKQSEAPTNNSHEPKHASPLRTIGWISLGLGAGSLVAGGITGAMAMNKAKIVDRDCLDDFCRTNEGKRAADQGNTLAAISTATFIAGGVLAASGITLVLVAPRKEKERPQQALFVQPVWGGAGLHYQGSF